MTPLTEIIAALDLKVLSAADHVGGRQVEGGYTSDLLSCVMAGAGKDNIWVTIQAHANIIAVAALLDVAAIVITEGAMPGDDTIAKANEEGVILLGTALPSYTVIGKLWDLGIKNCI